MRCMSPSSPKTAYLLGVRLARCALHLMHASKLNVWPLSKEKTKLNPLPLEGTTANNPVIFFHRYSSSMSFLNVFSCGLVRSSCSFVRHWRTAGKNEENA